MALKEPEPEKYARGKKKKKKKNMLLFLCVLALFVFVFAERAKPIWLRVLGLFPSFGFVWVWLCFCEEKIYGIWMNDYFTFLFETFFAPITSIHNIVELQLSDIRWTDLPGIPPTTLSRALHVIRPKLDDTEWAVSTPCGVIHHVYAYFVV